MRSSYISYKLLNVNMCSLIFLFITAIIYTNTASPIVKISSGLIEGTFVQNKITEKPYYSFKGIPYAEPPIGKLRFQPPIKVKSWINTLEAKTDGSKCIQNYKGSEDCLYLNVYTPKLPTNTDNESLAVMVYFHGGAFVHGSSNSKYYGPEYLIDKNIVLVTLNYRLQIFGFLNFLDEFSSGNVGLKDQLAALNWVQENIDKFGGDSKKVTIFGQSAGSASCQYLLQSKLAKGLFHRAILQSGSTLNKWAFESNPKEVINKLKSALDCENKNYSEFMTFLKTISSEQLYNASTNILEGKHRLIRQRFIPSIENNLPTSLITESSYSILSNNNVNSVPIMSGYVNFEGLIFLSEIQKEKTILESYINSTLLVPSSMNIIDNNTLKVVSEEIEKYYFHNTTILNVEAFLKFMSDEYFVRGIRKHSELMRTNNEIYFYKINYQNKNKTAKYQGVPHTEELKYIFYKEVEESSEEKIIRQRITTLWTNFAKTGNPTPKEDPLLNNIKWLTVSKNKNDSFHYLDIGEQLSMKENPDEENFKFWENLFKKYGNEPFSIF